MNQTYYNRAQILMMEQYRIPMGDVEFFTLICDTFDEQEIDKISNAEMGLISMHDGKDHRYMAMTRTRRLVKLGFLQDQQISRYVKLTKTGQLWREKITGDRGLKYVQIQGGAIDLFVKHMDKVVSVRKGIKTGEERTTYSHFIDVKSYEEVKQKHNYYKM